MKGGGLLMWTVKGLLTIAVFVAVLAFCIQPGPAAKVTATAATAMGQGIGITFGSLGSLASGLQAGQKASEGVNPKLDAGQADAKAPAAKASEKAASGKDGD